MSTIPQFSTRGEEHGSLVISHKEYVQDITGSTLFSNNGFPINPGDPALFPWLSQIAANYDEYEFKGLVFTYRTVTTDLSTTSAQLGTVMMACNYNAGAPLFGTKQELLQYDGAGDVKISHDLMFGIECDPRKNGLGGILYVAINGSVPIGQDVKTYMLGQFQIATNQCVTTGQIGELWVSYKVVLRKPKFATGLGNAIPYSNLRLKLVTNSGASAGTAAVSLQANNLEDIVYGSTGGGTIFGTGGGSWVNNGVSSGNVNLLTDSVYGGLTTVVSTSAQQSFPSGFVAQQFVGWNVYWNATDVHVLYFFPEWLQNGSYQLTMTVYAAGDNPAQVALGGFEFYINGGTQATPGLNANLISVLPSGSTSLDYEGGGNQLSGVCTVKQSFQSQTVPAPTATLTSPKPQLVGIHMHATGSFTANMIVNLSVQQINPGALTVPVF